MSATTRFREQHDGLLALATEISACLDANEISQDASKVKSLLSKLMGKLKVHLAMEDKSLYPSLLEKGDDQLKAMTQRFIDEMGGIGEAVETYADKWSTASAIQNDVQGFISETNAIFAALAERIDKENNELYAAFDAL